MALSARFLAAVEKAFAKADDLVIQGIFVSTTEQAEFDFLAPAQEEATTTTVVDILVFSTETKENYIVKKAVVRSRDFDNSRYNEIAFGSERYRIVNHTDYKFIVELELQKEI